MPLTITVPDTLAGQLQSRAKAENIPVDELASRFLVSGMQSPLEPEKWSVVNARRVALIEKRYRSGLAEEEEMELERLQELADLQVAEMDAAILNHVDRMEARVRKVLGGAE